MTPAENDPNQPEEGHRPSEGAPLHPETTSAHDQKRELIRQVLNPPPLRNKPAEIFSGIILTAAAVFGLYRFTPAILNSLKPEAPQIITGSTPLGELSREEVTKLLDSSFAEHPVVARVPLGDVATINSEGHNLTLYSKLAAAEVIRLRLCRFPGANGPGKEMCVADLTEKGKQLAYAESKASKVLSTGVDFPTSNRVYVAFEVAVPKLEKLSGIAGDMREVVTVTYEATLQSTAMASTIGVEDQIPSRVSGSAELRTSSAGWQVVKAELNQSAQP